MNLQESQEDAVIWSSPPVLDPEAQRRLDRRHRRRRSAIDIVIVFGLLLVLSAIGAVVWPGRFPFLSQPNIVTGLEAIPLLAIPAIGVGILMVAGEFDLSIGSNFVFSSMVMAMLAESGISLFLAALAGVAMGIAIGLLNGLISLWLRIPSFIATLGTTGVWAAATLFVHGASAQPFDTDGLFAAVTSGRLGSWIPAAAIWLVIVGVLAGLLLHAHRFGNHVYAAGGNAQSATATGVAVRTTKLVAFALTGGLAALAGVLAAARVNNVTPGGSVDLPLMAIAACVIGGVALTGGRGTVSGIVVGAALIYWIQDVLLLLGAPGFYLSAFVGVLIIAAATFYRVTRERRLN